MLADVSNTMEWEFSARKGLAFIAVQESRPADALKELERCLELNPEPDGDFANLLAGVYFRLGDHDKALIWYEKALDAPAPSDPAYANLCYLLQTAGQWKKLLSIADTAFSIYPEESAFGFYKAEALARLDYPSEAASLLGKLSQSSQEAAFRSAYELAVLYHSQGNKLASKYASEFVKAVAYQRRPTVRDECMAIGKLAIDLGDNALAIEALHQVLRMKPSEVAAHKLLAACYSELDQHDRSEEHLTLARQFGGFVE